MPIENGAPKYTRAAMKAAFEQAKSKLTPAQQHIIKQLLGGPKDTKALGDSLISFDPNTYGGSKGSTYKELRDARIRLRDFYISTEGFSQRLRLELPRAKRGELHTLTASENIPPKDATGFWAAHFGNGKPTRFITDRVLVDARHEIQVRTHDSKEVMHWVEAGRNAENRSVPYMAVPDVQAMLHLFSYFDEWHRVHRQPAPEVLSTDLADSSASNCVVLGTPFENSAILDFEIYAEERNQSCLFFDRACKNYRRTDASGEYRVWVHRFWPGPSVATVIQASDSAALSGICTVLTSNSEMKRLIGEICFSEPWKGFPPEFAMEFRIRLSNEEPQTGRECKVQRVRINDYQDMPGWGRTLDGKFFRPTMPGDAAPSEWRSIW